MNLRNHRRNHGKKWREEEEKENAHTIFIMKFSKNNEKAMSEHVSVIRRISDETILDDPDGSKFKGKILRINMTHVRSTCRNRSRE